MAIRHTDYFLLLFDVKSRIDKKEWEEEMPLGLEPMSTLLNEKHPKQVIDARRRFARRRRSHEFKMEAW